MRAEQMRSQRRIAISPAPEETSTATLTGLSAAALWVLRSRK